MRNVLVVGCGITGSTIVHMLKRMAPQVAVQVWDKGARGGGRYTTFTEPQTGATCDMGCQVVFPDQSGHLGYHAETAMYEMLRQRHLLRLANVAVRDAIPGSPPQVLVGGRKGMTGVTTFLCGDVPVSQAVRVVRLDVSSEADDTPTSGPARRWRVTAECGRSQAFDAVVLTMPAPQILSDLRGDITRVLVERGLTGMLGQAKYCSKYALGLVYPHTAHSAFSSLPWTIHQPPDDPVIGYLSLEHKKRPHAQEDGALPSTTSPVLLVHSTTQFAEEHVDSDQALVTRLLREAVARILPGLSEPVALKFNKWRYSQVVNRVPGDHGGAIALSADSEGRHGASNTVSPGSDSSSSSSISSSGVGGGSSGERHGLLVLAGDAFTDSTFDGCVHSARRAVDLLLGQ